MEITPKVPYRERKKVYMTVLSTEDYIRGVKALKRSLISVKSNYDLIILVPRSKEQRMRYLLAKNKVLDEHCALCVKDDIDETYFDYLKEAQPDHYWSNTFFKLNVANCVEFEKIVLLDSDMMVCQNIDHLFDKPHFSAVVAGHCRTAEWVKLNSGLMVIEPSKELFLELTDNIKPTIALRLNNGYRAGDQDVFQEAFKDWENHKELQLPEIYNCFFGDLRVLTEKENIKIHDIAVIHFIGKIKPWSRGVSAVKKNLTTIFNFTSNLQFQEIKILLKYLLFSL